MRGILTAAVCVGLVSTSFAQQDPQFSQYMFDRLSINSGVAGTSGNICATALLRQQWTGFDGAPKTGLINIQAPINKINSGVGLSIYFDELGQMKTNTVRLHYAYHFKPGGGVGTLGVGLYAGLLSRSLAGNWVAVDDVTTDDAIPDGGASDSGFDMGGGIYYTHPKFWVGLSSTQLPQTQLQNVYIQNARHYYVQAGYNWDINGDNKWTLQPSVLLKSDAASTQLDVNAMMLYNKQIWLGVTYRTEDAIAPMLGYQHEAANGNSSYRIGYSYDLTTSELKNYSSGSHEVMLNYCFKIVPVPKRTIYRNPRFL